MGDVNLFVDRSTKRAVFSDKSKGIATLPPFFYGNLQPFVISVLDPSGLVDENGNLITPFWSKANLSSQGLRMIFLKSPTDTTKIAEQATWTWGAATSSFSGSIDLSTANFLTALNGEASIDGFLEIATVNDNRRTTIFQQKVILKKAGDVTAAVNPSITDPLLTTGEANNTYVRILGLPGQEITLVHKNGKSVTLRCSADGNLEEIQSP